MHPVHTHLTQLACPTDLAPLYQHICQETGWSPDGSQQQRMQSANEKKMQELEGKIKDAEENLGDTEVKEALTAKADYLCRIGQYSLPLIICACSSIQIKLCICITAHVCNKPCPCIVAHVAHQVQKIEAVVCMHIFEKFVKIVCLQSLLSFCYNAHLNFYAMLVEFTCRRQESGRGGIQEGRGKDSRLWPKNGHGFQQSQVCTLRCCTCIHSHTHQYKFFLPHSYSIDVSKLVSSCSERFLHTTWPNLAWAGRPQRPVCSSTLPPACYTAFFCLCAVPATYKCSCTRAGETTTAATEQSIKQQHV